MNKTHFIRTFVGISKISIYKIPRENWKTLLSNVNRAVGYHLNNTFMREITKHVHC